MRLTLEDAPTLFAQTCLDQPILIGQDFGTVCNSRSVTLAQAAGAVPMPLATQDRLLGVFPFDRGAPGYLYCIQTAPAPPVAPPREAHSRSLTRFPVQAEYGQAVAAAAQRIGAPGADLAKVVLARALEFETDAEIDPLQTAQTLAADRHVTSYCVPLPSAGGTGPKWLVGATPELLLSKRAGAVISHPLAGSARRSADPQADQYAAQSLSRSAKDLAEHRVVVDYIHDILAPYCKTLDVPGAPQLDRTATMWHLGTPIQGVLKDPDTPCLELLYRLHPTPAVAGHPLQTALEVIAQSEPFERGFYAGTLGWLDGQNDGAWYVTLRCALIDGHRARLFAGAGIVAQSDPASEIAETGAKFAAMRKALGICDTL
ncbi:isochorismate synthase MenF [Thioclava sp. SK-1]|uniref:isochorismate synthase n=1 Tax=Thioclava sp. SK-1 TaxID=1889770 RepID=UPI000A45B870|nr:isochorismate synthase [Thioclava sp. SK-1]